MLRFFLPAVLLAALTAHLHAGLRPSAVPLVAHDPYFSVWSPADKLTDAPTMHWTRKAQPLRSLVRIDGTAFRLMGPEPSAVPALPQTSLEVLPTRTIYHFANDQLELTLTFLTPALPDDLAVLARPLTYLSWQARSLDHQPHRVEVYFDCGAEIAVNTPEQIVRAERPGPGVIRVGTVTQPVLARQGDDVRIDWGYAYLAADETRLAPGEAARAEFARSGNLSATDAPATDAAASAAPVLAARLDLGPVADTPVRRSLVLAYDDILSLRYFEADLPGYWRHGGLTMEKLLPLAVREFPALEKRCVDFDTRLMAELTRIGGSDYADLGALCYRQTLAGSKLVADARGQPLFFPKENLSNGCIGTVDVIYPMAPFTLLFSPALTKAMLQPILDYAASPRWKFDFAPHDLGRYPHATGQVYGGGEKTLDRQMMVEESANMILLVAALARAEGNADYAAPYWPQLTTWAAYLRAKGFDPENQLCTDDFAGHLAHNVNLSAKAIVALGAYARLCETRKDPVTAKTYRDLATGLAARWAREADDGTHFRLAFDQPGSWSQKYNLVWDRLLDLGLFPETALRKEMDFYRTRLAPYGLPLDSRQPYTKLDWTIWTATLTGRRDDLDALLGPVMKFINTTPDRVPLTDWYMTDTARLRGFIARPVVGGVFIAILGEPATWQRWAKAGANTTATWAPLPIRQSHSLAPTAEDAPVLWRHAFTEPAANWTAPEFDDSAWSEAPAPFGTAKNNLITPPRTPWPKGGLWLRRQFTLAARPTGDLRLRVAAPSAADIYLNGILAAQVPGAIRDYQHVSLSPAALAALQAGRNTLAAYSVRPSGGRAENLDVGLIVLEP